jgi:hypothetical protein
VRFPFPLLPAEFEIPDEWWIEAGMAGFTPSARGFRSAAGSTLIPLRDIEPPYRNSTAPKDWRGFDRTRLISVLAGIATGAEVAPVPVLGMPQPAEPSDPSLSWIVPRSPFSHRVKDGYHRFYASVAAGFECLPVTVS